MDVMFPRENIDPRHVSSSTCNSLKSADDRDQVLLLEPKLRDAFTVVEHATDVFLGSLGIVDYRKVYAR